MPASGSADTTDLCVASGSRTPRHPKLKHGPTEHLDAPGEPDGFLFRLPGHT